MRSFRFLLPVVACFIFVEISAQTDSAKFGDGISFVPADSSMSVNFSTRFQTLIEVNTVLNDDPAPEVGMAIRRFRLKFDGFAHSTKLRYKIELALSNNDNGRIVPQGDNGANIVLDAYAEYQLAEGLWLRGGQFKLPGNRERVISSQQLQFVDRSLVNSRYNLDRDLGLMLRHEFPIGNWIVRDLWAVAKGEGRNITMESDIGLSYTGRIELLPFGNFTDEGDYFGSDLAREPTPKFSIAGGYSYNDEAVRSQGELGSFLPLPQDLSTIFADFMFKYRGLSIMGEYMSKSAPDPVLESGDGFFVTGDGVVLQSGYLLKNDLEFALRYTTVRPADHTFDLGIDQQRTEYTLGVSKYIVGHSLKIQTDISYTNIDRSGTTAIDPFLAYRLQMELAL